MLGCYQPSTLRQCSTLHQTVGEEKEQLHQTARGRAAYLRVTASRILTTLELQGLAQVSSEKILSCKRQKASMSAPRLKQTITLG